MTRLVVLLALSTIACRAAQASAPASFEHVDLGNDRIGNVVQLGAQASLF